MATVLTNVGEQNVVEALRATGYTQPVNIGWGTGAGTAAKGDTTLFTESAEARVAGTSSLTGTGATAKWQLVGTITSAGAQTITNAGCFDAATAGDMFIKGDFTGIVLAANDAIEFTITLDPG